MDYLALKIPADIKQPITSHTVTDQPEPERVEGIHSKVITAHMSYAAQTCCRSCPQRIRT